MSLRVLSWNVHDMLGDPLLVARLLRESAADVACLQEAPRWPGSRLRLRTLARNSGMRYLTGGRAAAGVAMLVSARTDVHAATAFRLPTAAGWRVRPRGAAVATVSLPGEPRLTIASVHLGLAPAERAAHVPLVLAALGDADAVAVAGDLNETPAGPSWAALAARVRDPAPGAPLTYPAHHPRRRIDAVLASPSVTVTDYATWRPQNVKLASDHHPVLATLTPNADSA